MVLYYVNSDNKMSENNIVAFDPDLRMDIQTRLMYFDKLCSKDYNYIVGTSNGIYLFEVLFELVFLCRHNLIILKLKTSNCFWIKLIFLTYVKMPIPT